MRELPESYMSRMNGYILALDGDALNGIAEILREFRVDQVTLDGVDVKLCLLSDEELAEEEPDEYTG